MLKPYYFNEVFLAPALLFFFYVVDGKAFNDGGFYNKIAVDTVAFDIINPQPIYSHSVKKVAIFSLTKFTYMLTFVYEEY